MHGTATAELDVRAGANWLARASAAERVELLAALLTRFNHDFRTPLNTITGWGHLLQQGSLEPDRIRHVADVIARNAREETLMFEAFIEDARIILGRVQVEPTTVRLDELVAQVIAQASGSERSSRSSLRVTIDAGEALIDGNSRALQRLIIRLAAAIARRTHEAATIDLVVSNEDRRICFSLTAPTSDADWSESDLLELRISTLMASVFRGTLELLANPETAALRVLLPQAARAA